MWLKNGKHCPDARLLLETESATITGEHFMMPMGFLLGRREQIMEAVMTAAVRRRGPRKKVI
jgi:hypothetical protein